MKKPRILFYDVETTPVKVWTFRIGQKVSISHENIVDGEKFDIICICYKWQGEKKIRSLDWGCNKQDSAKMIEEFTKVVESADVAIAHNGDKFDFKQINTQRMLHKQDPIAWPTSDDTLKQLRKHFYFASYKLDYITKVLFGEGKSEMAFRDWINIKQYKDPQALAKMLRYCRRDVWLLERTFKRTSKYFMPKVNASIVIWEDRLGCPHCGGRERSKAGTRGTLSGVYQRWRCSSCRHVSKGKKIAS